MKKETRKSITSKRRKAIAEALRNGMLHHNVRWKFKCSMAQVSQIRKELAEELCPANGREVPA